MVYYKSERKELIIPSGFGTLVSGGSSDCSEAIAEAYQSGYTEGFQSGITNGMKVFSTQLSFEFDPIPTADSTLFTEPPRNLKVDGNYIGIDDAIWITYGSRYYGSGEYEVVDEILLGFRTQNCTVVKTEFDLAVERGSVVPSEFINIKAGQNAEASGETVQAYSQSISFIETTDNTDWYKVAIEFAAPIIIEPSYKEAYDEGYAAGLADCQNNENQ